MIQINKINKINIMPPMEKFITFFIEANSKLLLKKIRFRFIETAYTPALKVNFSNEIMKYDICLAESGKVVE